MVVTGDPTQVDLPKGQISGLSEALNLLKNIDDIATITFTRGDVVRRELVAKIVAAYEEATEI
jgi:phosphate starvation-inducible protein PhoH and related proteins